MLLEEGRSVGFMQAEARRASDRRRRTRSASGESEDEAKEKRGLYGLLDLFS